MSESGHSQPGLYGIERRRRWKEPGPGGPQNLSGPGGRERDYIAPWERERRDGSEETGASVMQKTPIILSKPPAERSKQPPPPTPAPAAPPAPAPLEKPIVLMKPREEGKGPTASTGASTPEGTAPPPPAAPAPPKGEKEGQRPTQPVYQIQNRGMGTAAPAAMDPVVGQAKLLPPERMKHSIKLVDDQMNWCDSAIEYLLDQTDVLVVGVLGLQGTGKSMVMSLLSANTPEEDQRAYVFRAQSAEMKERGGNQTSGIDFFITQERIVFLDTQPILSPSILDHLINNDRKLPPEYNLPHTYVEMQSLQIAAFLFTVCHVVIVVQDWFTDLSLYRRFLQTAEMVKPSTPSPSHESSSSSGSDEGTEYYPHLVFLQNKARREDFCPRKLRQMHLMIDQLMAHSHLRYKGEGVQSPQTPRYRGVRVPNPPQMPRYRSEGAQPPQTLRYKGEDAQPPPTPHYRGEGAQAPPRHCVTGHLKSQLWGLGSERLRPTPQTSSHRFHYAARIWDGVRKSSALAEYSRLLA
uniref:Nonsense-mediated mRNA decay factor SMG9 n=1 Tax=Loxodonta africana TaxID=9785 RepID=G3U280_LOXAF